MRLSLSARAAWRLRVAIADAVVRRRAARYARRCIFQRVSSAAGRCRHRVSLVDAPRAVPWNTKRARPKEQANILRRTQPASALSLFSCLSVCMYMSLYLEKHSFDRVPLRISRPRRVWDLPRARLEAAGRKHLPVAAGSLCVVREETLRNRPTRQSLSFSQPREINADAQIPAR